MRGDYSTSGPKLSSTVAQKSVKVGTFQQKGVLSDKLLDEREDYGEDRWIGIGILRNIVAVVVFTEPRQDTIRIISARKANKHERKRYKQALTN